MSILIKGMEMPEYCIDCYFYASNSRNDSCLLLKRTLGNDGDRESDCPLAGVPTPHGRLIDAEDMLFDEAEAFISAQVQLEKNGDTVNQLINEVVHKKIQMLIADTPTIVEGEDGT